MKRALIVGINVYPDQPLMGCVNDATNMANFLVKERGFIMDNVRVLVDKRATTQAILERLRWLVAGAQKGDTLLFHYSGHGTLFPMRDAAGHVSEAHCAICPVDFDWTRQHAILDEDIRKIVNQVADNVEFIFVSDSCNSGDLLKVFGLTAPRFLRPPADIAWQIQTAIEKGITFREVTVHDRCALLAGCRSDQTSADAPMPDGYEGAFTHFLLQALRADTPPRKPLRDLVQEVGAALKVKNFTQEPQVRGPEWLLSQDFL